MVPTGAGPGTVPPLREQLGLWGVEVCFEGHLAWQGSAVGSGQSRSQPLTCPPAPHRVTALTRTAWVIPGSRVPRAFPAREASRWVSSPSVELPFSSSSPPPPSQPFPLCMGATGGPSVPLGAGVEPGPCPPHPWSCLMHPSLPGLTRTAGTPGATWAHRKYPLPGAEGGHRVMVLGGLDTAPPRHAASCQGGPAPCPEAMVMGRGLGGRGAAWHGCPRRVWTWR